ncbi:MAG: HAD family phosphatase [Clostridiaceae bacterium]|nr:HAD family phosphatase [Clostridiaceae bacterium]
MLNNIKAAIFDLDGTLVDSMWIWDKIDTDFLNSYGYDVPLNLKDEINHLSFEGTAHYFKDRFKIKDSIEHILNTWNTMAYDHYSNDVKLKDGVLEFLKYLKSLNIKIALATSNNTLLLEAVLKSNNIYDYFDCITTTAEVKHGKNHPDVYLLTANKLDILAEECIVFEDILEAVQGAKLANMKVVAVADGAAEYQKNDLISIADKYIVSFKELIK